MKGTEEEIRRICNKIINDGRCDAHWLCSECPINSDQAIPCLEKAREWLKQHPEQCSNEYIIEPVKGTPVWVRYGIKCRFWGEDKKKAKIGVLVGYRSDNTYYPFEAHFEDRGVTDAYEHASPILASEESVSQNKKSKYQIERPKDLLDWVQFGVKCNFTRYGSVVAHYKGFLFGIKRIENHGYVYIADDGRWYDTIEPILLDEKRIPRDDEPVACWDDGEKYYRIRVFYDDTNKATESWKHVTSYHGQLDMRIEALKDEEVYQ